MSASRRLKKARNSLGITQEQLGNSIGLKRDAITNLESGKVKISTLHALSLEYIHKISSEWLLNGHGEMFLSNAHKEKKPEPNTKPPIGNAIRVYNNVLKRTGLELDPEGQEKLFQLIQEMLEDAATNEAEDKLVDSISIANHKVKGT